MLLFNVLECRKRGYRTNDRHIFSAFSLLNISTNRCTPKHIDKPYENKIKSTIIPHKKKKLIHQP